MWKVVAADDEGYIREALQKLINWEKMDCSLESVVSDGQELLENEFKILQMLLENTGKIVSRESIMTRLWDSNEFIDDNTLTVNVARLRKKMEQIGLGGKIITKKGIGYMVEA